MKIETSSAANSNEIIVYKLFGLDMRLFEKNYRRRILFEISLAFVFKPNWDREGKKEAKNQLRL